ncbi:class C sortase [Enterococcus camelliae]|uniref:Class C sortase n=1 Tax=Enterococcus camelliae TaxID=453959 RepID=A0ABW5TL18_9ENTE
MEKKTKRLSKDDKINFFLKFLMMTLFVVGAIIFFYPFVADALNNYLDQQRISYYINQTEKENQTKLKAEAQRMAEKNAKLATSITVPGMTNVKDPFADIHDYADKPTQAYYQQHNIGAIFIPAIEVSLPLFDTTNDRLLEEGATVLQGTSYPIGGESTHSVITGHTGLPNKLLFTNLTELTKGDMIYLHVLNKKLAYKIRSFHVVKPDQLDNLKIVPGQDLITLVTCTPYMINTDRLLVTAERVAYKEDPVKKSIQKTQNYHRLKLVYTIMGILVFFGLFFFWVARKIWLFRGLKRQYEATFYLENQGHAVQGVNVQLVRGWNKRPLKIDQQVVVAVSDQAGRVAFQSIPGGNYRAVVMGEERAWPTIRIRLEKLRATHLGVRVGQKNRRIVKEGTSSNRIYVQKRNLQH